MFENTLSFAQECDAKDELSDFRDQFYIPQHEGKDCIYLVGNSLGLQPKSLRKFIEEELIDWQNLGVEGHFDESAKRPWFHYHKFLKPHLARIAGAKESEVVSMNTLTTNLHLMMVSFYRPTEERFKIITEAGAFPSDQYTVETQLNFHAYQGGGRLFDPADALIELTPRSGEETLRTSDILEAIEEHKDSLALVMLPGVQYYTGQLFDIESITAKGHECGAKVGFDLAHAFGNVPLQLHDDGVDFAVWCSYKYLNSGPGGVSGIFVHERYDGDENLPRFGGWWGHKESERFQMKKGFVPMKGADAWQLSNVNVLASAAHLASLELFSEAGMDELRRKSIKLTNFMEFLIDDLNKDKQKIAIITPRNLEERGAQLSLCLNEAGREVFEGLSERGVIADWREPNVIRVAAVPMYNSFKDVWYFVQVLKDILHTP